jgi:hypothetical protein
MGPLKAIFGISLLLLASAITRGDSNLLRNAESAHDVALKDAAEKYRTAALEADRKYLIALQHALDSALEAKNLDEANRINAKIRETKGAPQLKALPTVTLPNEVAGKWRQIVNRSDEYLLELFADGRASVTIKGGATKPLGSWRKRDNQLTVTWPDGVIDTYRMDDPSELRGTSNKNSSISLVKLWNQR